MWNSIVSITDHFLFIYFTKMHSKTESILNLKNSGNFVLKNGKSETGQLLFQNGETDQPVLQLREVLFITTDGGSFSPLVIPIEDAKGFMHTIEDSNGSLESLHWIQQSRSKENDREPIQSQEAHVCVMTAEPVKSSRT